MNLKTKIEIAAKRRKQRKKTRRYGATRPRSSFTSWVKQFRFFGRILRSLIFRLLRFFAAILTAEFKMNMPVELI